MSSPARLSLALIAALLLGAGAAVVAAHVTPGPIRLVGNTEKRLTIRGSDGAEALTIMGDANGDVDLNADRPFENMRTDCETFGPAATNATCTSEISKLEASLADGSDELVFRNFKSRRSRVAATGGGGGDRLAGSEAGDALDGGVGNDDLLGRGGGDDLNGGSGHDHCNGGSGVDHLSGCE